MQGVSLENNIAVVNNSAPSLASGCGLQVRIFPGQSDYKTIWDLQRQLQTELIQKRGPETLLLCQHPPTITLGRAAKISNILVSDQELAQRGVQRFEIERGGDVTYHGPGQLVAYPILNLSKRKTDVGWYMRTLEEVIIQTLQSFNTTGLRVPGRTGVWTQAHGNDKYLRKIAAIGVRISRWCTMHGLAINVHNCQAGFDLINPCGFSDIAVTSIEQETGNKIEIDLVIQKFLGSFQQNFGGFSD